MSTDKKTKRSYPADERRRSNVSGTMRRPETGRRDSSLAPGAVELDSFFSLATDLLCIGDFSRGFVRVNQAWYDSLGYTLEEVLEKSTTELVHPDDQQRVVEAIGRLRDGREIHNLVIRYLCKNGSYRSYEWRATPFDQRLIFAIGRDITDRLESDRKLTISENRYRFYMDNLVGIAYQADLGTFSPNFMHGAVEEITGYSAQDFVERKLRWADIIHKDDLPNVVRESSRLRNEPDYLVATEYRVVRKDETIRWVKDVGKAAVVEQDGTLVANGLIWDITEMRRSEEKARREDSFRRAIIDRAAEGMLVCHQIDEPPFIRVTVWNERMVEITGYKIEEINQDGFFQSLYPDPGGQQWVLKRFERILQSDDMRAEEWPITRKDGTVRTLAISSATLPGEDNSIHVLGLVHDLTDRKQAEELLRRSEERLRSIFRAAPVGIGLERNRFLAQINEKVCEMTGYTERELIGQSKRILYVSDEEFDRVGHEKLVQIRETGAATIETRYQRKDGRVIDVLMSSVPLDPDDPAGDITFSVVDITERKRASEALRAAVEGTAGVTGDAFFQTLVRTLAEALNVHHAFVGELIGNPPTDLLPLAAWMDGEFVDDFFCRVETSPCVQVIRDKLCFCSTGLRDLFPNDKKLAAIGADSFFGVCLFDANNRPSGILAVMDDRVMQRATLTESLLTIFSTRAAAELDRKRAEENRIKLEAQIQHVQKLESLGVLAGGIAHDFNNLLMVILGNADLARRTLAPASPGQVFLQDIETASRRAADLCCQMLAYSGKGRFVVQTLDLNQLVEEMTRMLEVSISKKAVLKYNYAANLPAIEADATQVRQVLMNLITNASEAIGDQSGIISITTGVMKCERDYLSDTFLDEGLLDGLYVFIEIADTGCGMTPEVRKRLFDPFFSTKFTGRGLGMAAVLGIVRGHKGTVKIYTEVDKGTTVKVLFPASKTPLPKPEDSRDSDTEWQGQGTIMVVDDEESVLVVTANILELMGFQTLSAKDGQEALKVYREHKREIVCVLLDLTMPHMDGEETFRELRRIDRDVRVIMSSGYNEQEVTQRFVGKGLAGFIQKPYQYEKLLTKLREVLKK